MERERPAIVEINSIGRAVIDSPPEGMKEGSKEYESEMEVKGERGRNKTTQGHSRPPALLLLLFYTHINSNAPSSVKGRRLTKWARDYWRERFSVQTSDEANVNSLHSEVMEEGRGWEMH